MQGLIEFINMLVVGCMVALTAFLCSGIPLAELMAFELVVVLVVAFILHITELLSLLGDKLWHLRG